MLKSNVIRFTFLGDYHRDALQARELGRGHYKKKKKKLARHDEYMNEAKGQCINSHLF